MAQPEYWNDSSSTDTDEEWEQDAQMFAMTFEQANASSSSIPCSKVPNIDRGRVEGNTRLIADYFSDNPTYPEEMFKRRFRMSRLLGFLWISSAQTDLRIISDLPKPRWFDIPHRLIKLIKPM
ncbi:hypothetical protein OSB04_005702 [Centaurea solstitialis]|uniref:Uncharacterized protein n=1 Tax=Centaurea solstitialis TaxID=347529 RepID=A0AA38WGQ9_9ASTR|nr:hypothetical protein OSB04_005702 [Centaurea solstitialis]